MSRHQLKPQPTAQERMERRRQAKAQAQQRKNYYQLEKYAGLAFDYGQIAEQHRVTVQDAALAIRRWQRDTIAVGRTFLGVKELLPHRQFLDWLEIEFGLKERSIQSIMNVARVYDEPEKAQRVALLSAGALYELAAPSTPAEARTAIEAQIAAGANPTRSEVKRTIDGYKPPKQLGSSLGAPPVAQLPGPVEPEPDDAIDAEYTVVPKHEFIFPDKPKRGDQIAPIISRSLARKLQDALLHRIFKTVLTPDEQDELLVALTRALEE